MDYNQNTGVVHGGAAGAYGNAYAGHSVSGSHGVAYNTNTGNPYADHDGNVYKATPGSDSGCLNDGATSIPADGWWRLG